MNTKVYHAHMYYLQSLAREIINEGRVCACCRIAVPGKSVQVWSNPEIQRARYRNVARCADVWACPVCANQITANRRDDLRAIVKALRPKTIIIMVSFTLRHKRRDGLVDSLTCLLDAWRGMTSCRKWDKVRTQCAGYVRALETTWGDTNGWHPHLHVVFFVYPEHCIKGLYANLRKWWDAAVTAAGGDSDVAVATRMTLDFKEIESYVAKWGIAEETTRGMMSKERDGGVTPFEMLDVYGRAKSDPEASPSPALIGLLFREYLRAFRGKRQLSWSRKPDIRAAAKLAEEKPEDEIIEGEGAGYVLLAQLTNDEWQAIIHCAKRGELLDHAAQGDVGAMRLLMDMCLRVRGEYLGRVSA